MRAGVYLIPDAWVEAQSVEKDLLLCLTGCTSGGGASETNTLQFDPLRSAQGPSPLFMTS